MQKIGISIQELIIEIVNEEDGIRGLELLSKLLIDSANRSIKYTTAELFKILDDMITNKELKRIEYYNTSSGKIKTIFLPKDTIIHID